MPGYFSLFLDSPSPTVGRYTRPQSIVQAPHTAPHAMELLLTSNRSDHPMLALLRFLQVEEPPRLIVAFFTDFFHIHQFFHQITSSFSDTTVFLNIRSHVAYLRVEVDSKHKKKTSLVQNSQIVCIFARKAERRAAIFRIVWSGPVKKRVGAQWRGTELHPMSILFSAVRMRNAHADSRTQRHETFNAHPRHHPKSQAHVSFCHATNLADPHQIRPTEWSQAEKRQIMNQSYSWSPVTLCSSCKLSRTRAIRACSSASASEGQPGKRR